MGTPRISEAFEIFRIEYIVYRNQSAKTEEMSQCAMRSLIEFVGDIPIESLTFDMVRKWKEHLQKTRSQNTVRGYIIKLRVVLKHMAQKGYIGIINHEIVGVPKREQKIVEFLLPADVTLFIDAALKAAPGYSQINRYKNAAIISLLYGSGIRVSELCSLDRASFREGLDTFTVIGKGNKPRLCFSDERTQQFVQKYLSLRSDNNPALFVSNFNRITPGIIQLMFRINSKRAGMDTITPHWMRHSYATNLLRNNTNLIYVKTFLGHSSVQTTEMYTHVVNEDLRAIYREKHTI